MYRNRIRRFTPAVVEAALWKPAPPTGAMARSTFESAAAIRVHLK